MADFNKVIIMGNLTRDPELKYIPSGQAVCSFSLALNNKYTSSNGEAKNDVSYIDIVVFGKAGENCNQYLSKGRSAMVEGRLQQRRWESQDGQKRSKVEVVAQSVTFMPKAESNSGGDRQQPNSNQGGQQENNQAVNLNDVPF